ncbi:MAG: oxidoreductase [Actinomycetota bacterium]
MRIEVVGGGPAGLYFALLAKKANPDHEIAVHERNAPDATFGWGVVFSEETLGSFRDADHETWTEITDTFARWGAIDIHYGGDVVRARGQSFSGIARKRLLQILQRRCRDVGVELAFNAEVPNLSAFAGADLVVGADGVNSTVRRLMADRFRPKELVHRTKFVWFGTDLVFRAFTFIFRETEHGMFQGHAYPFDADLSTFVVECREDAWRQAGLEGAGEEESIAFCQELFAPELAGHKLLSNRSLWISFVTLRCEAWHHGNVALLGDAAHTAHFTIGSGTKLAMEDAIALARALERHPKNLETALTNYEMERQPAVERLQQAALESAAYFENVGRYAGFTPVQFAVNLLTRSGRISYANLTQRDPELVRRADTRFAARARGVGERSVAPPPAFVPLWLRRLELPNRLVVAAEDHPGAGLILTEMVAVSEDARVTPETPVASAATLLALAERGGVPVALRLGHAGRRGATRSRRLGTDLALPDGGWPLVSASALAFAPGCRIPKEMDRADMNRVLGDFAQATRAAAKAGFDLLEVDAGQGYLLASFLSPLSNRRDDEYGGSLEDRMRFPLEVVDSVRSAWPADRPLAVRLSATDWVQGGFDVEDAVTIARALIDRGCDLIHVVAAGTTPRANPDYGPGYLLSASDRIRNEGGSLVLVGGYLTTLDQVNTALAAGRADLCVLDTRSPAKAVRPS